MTEKLIRKTGKHLHGLAHTVFRYDTAWVVFLAGTSGLILLFQLVQLQFVLGHDVYFHIHAAELISQNFPNIPSVIPYYWNGLDFGYPPLLHLIAAAISIITPLSVVSFFKIVPAIFLSAAILLSYLLYKAINADIAVIATVVFVSLIPFHWALFAGEYPRMLASVFAIAFLYTYRQLKQTRGVKYAIFSSLFGGLAIMSNMITFPIIGIYLLYELIRVHVETKQYYVLFVGLGVLLIASPWIIHTTYTFGITYLLEVLQVHQSAFNPIFSIAAVILFIGIHWKLRSKLPEGLYVWFILAFMWAKPSLWSIPAALIIAQLIHIPIERFVSKYSLSIQALFVSVALLIISVTTSGTYIYTDEYMNADVADAANWIENNTHENASLIAYLPVHSTSFDSINTLVDSITAVTRDENLPYFTHRKVYTWFGYEWNTDKGQIDTYTAFQEKACSTDFILNTAKYKIQPDYIWINKDSVSFNDPTVYCNDFDEPLFSTVYENNRILIKQYIHDDCDCFD